MRCTKCGANIEEGSRFCGACGEPVLIREIRPERTGGKPAGASDRGAGQAGSDAGHAYRVSGAAPGAKAVRSTGYANGPAGSPAPGAGKSAGAKNTRRGRKPDRENAPRPGRAVLIGVAALAVFLAAGIGIFLHARDSRQVVSSIGQEVSGGESVWYDVSFEDGISDESPVRGIFVFHDGLVTYYNVDSDKTLLDFANLTSAEITSDGDKFARRGYREQNERNKVIGEQAMEANQNSAEEFRRQADSYRKAGNAAAARQAEKAAETPVLYSDDDARDAITFQEDFESEDYRVTACDYRLLTEEDEQYEVLGFNAEEYPYFDDRDQKYYLPSIHTYTMELYPHDAEYVIDGQRFSGYSVGEETPGEDGHLLLTACKTHTSFLLDPADPPERTGSRLMAGDVRDLLDELTESATENYERLRESFPPAVQLDSENHKSSHPVRVEL